MTSNFNVGVGEIQAALGWGRTRVRTLINRPYSLTYQKRPSAPKGGNRARLYRLDELLVRLRNHKHATGEMISDLITADAINRNKE
jgi:hypothetical protein